VLSDSRAGFIFIAPFILSLIMAAMTGGSLAKADFWSARLGLISFAATRPVTTGELLMAKLKVGTVVLFAGWAIIMVLSPVAFNAPRWILPSEFPLPTWTEVKQIYPALIALLSNPILYAAVLALSWQSMVGALSISLLGQPNQVLMQSFVS